MRLPPTETDDQGCPTCGAPADEWCSKPDGKLRTDHVARIKLREETIATRREKERAALLQKENS